MFEIEAGTLADWLDKLKSEEYQLKITPEGWRVSGPDTENIMFVEALLKKEAFLKYEEIERTVPVDSHSRLKSFVDRFSGKMTVTLEENRLVLKEEGKGAKMSLGHEDIVQEFSEPKLVYDKWFRVNVKIFSESIKDAKLLSRNRYELSVKDKVFSIKVNNNVDEFVEETKVEYADASCAYGPMIEGIFGNLTGEVDVAFQDGAPLMVFCKNKASTVKYILAPRVEE